MSTDMKIALCALVCLTIVSIFMYLDHLRIKAIKRELKKAEETEKECLAQQKSVYEARLALYRKLSRQRHENHYWPENTTIQISDKVHHNQKE